MKRKQKEVMQCPSCSTGEMQRTKDIIEQDGIEFEAYRCKSCLEEILTMKQLKTLASKYRRLRMAKEITFTKWGNSIAVRIPKDIVRELNIEVGSSGILLKDKKEIKIIPA